VPALLHLQLHAFSFCHFAYLWKTVELLQQGARFALAANLHCSL
jgi:hypothetical protein